MEMINRKVPCEIYSRVVGYLRPLSQWHAGKIEEFKNRRVYRTPCIDELKDTVSASM